MKTVIIVVVIVIVVALVVVIGYLISEIINFFNA
jgi:hypothetical protein